MYDALLFNWQNKQTPKVMVINKSKMGHFLYILLMAAKNQS